MWLTLLLHIKKFQGFILNTEAGYNDLVFHCFPHLFIKWYDTFKYTTTADPLQFIIHNYCVTQCYITYAIRKYLLN
jgi:hypothetical protein